MNREATYLTVNDYTPIVPVGDGARGNGAHRRRYCPAHEGWSYDSPDDCRHLANMAADAFRGKRVVLVCGLHVDVKGLPCVGYRGGRCYPRILVSINTDNAVGDVYCDVHHILNIVG